MEYIIAIVVAAVLWGWVRNGAKSATGMRGYRSRPSARRRSPAASAASAVTSDPTYQWSDGGNFSFEIVGESNYQDTLQGLVGSDKAARGDAVFVATLVPENDNAHDDKAVGVYIGGSKVGHLSRSDARSFRRRLGAKKLTGQITLCPATVFGGRIVDGKVQSLGVWLDLRPFD